MHAAQHTHGSTPPVIHTPLWNSTNVRWQGGGEDQGGVPAVSVPWLRALVDYYDSPVRITQNPHWSRKVVPAGPNPISRLCWLRCGASCWADWADKPPIFPRSPTMHWPGITRAPRGSGGVHRECS